MLKERSTSALEAFSMDRAKTPLGSVIDLFRIYNQAEGKSGRTVSWYDERLEWLFREFGRDHPISEFTEEKLRLHIASYQRNAKNGEPLKPSTMNNHGRALRAFFNWAHREGFTPERLLARFRPHRIPFLVIEPLSDREIEAVLAAARFKRRDYAITCLLLDTGLRAFEACGLRAADVNLDEDWVKVMGKGAKERIVPFGKRTRKSLLTYVLNERPEGAPEDNLFLGHDGQHITPDTVRQIMDRLKRRSGVTRLHAHLLRHTFATRFLLAGGSALLLKQLLGHTTLAMVDRYVHLSSMRAVEVSRAFSPLDRLGTDGRENALPAPLTGPTAPSIREAWLRHRN
jgi:integrase/recombinase XerC/integrase/recombinase XerD